MKAKEEVFKVNYGPAKRGLAAVGQGFGIGALFAALGALLKILAVVVGGIVILIGLALRSEN